MNFRIVLHCFFTILLPYYLAAGVEVFTVFRWPVYGEPVLYLSCDSLPVLKIVGFRKQDNRYMRTQLLPY